MFCGCILLYNHLSINNHLNWCKKLFYVISGFSGIRIHIIWYGSGCRIQPFFDTDPDPGKWYGFHGSGSATLPKRYLKLLEQPNPTLSITWSFLRRRNGSHVDSSLSRLHKLNAQMHKWWPNNYRGNTVYSVSMSYICEYLCKKPDLDTRQYFSFATTRTC